MYKKTKKITIKQILIDWWPIFSSSFKNIRPVIILEVSKFLKCGDFSFGYHLFVCPNCNTFKHIAFTCKSRFCNSCGSLYSKKRANKIYSKLIKCKHRHIVFTIPEELRPFFAENRYLLNLLFEASSITISSWFKDISRINNFTPGMVSTLHTFGRDLKWNPHIHMLVTEGATGDYCEWKHVDFIPYGMLRDRFKYVLLNLLKKELKSKKFNALSNHIYAKTSHGFYVYADKTNFKDIKKGIEYVIRYIGRPAMAQSRITAYDGTYVTFKYTPHGSEDLTYSTIHAIDFLKLLFRHLPDKNFKMLRYYGIYAKKHKNHNKLYKLLSDAKSKFIKATNNFRNNMLISFGIDPLSCYKCKNELEYVDTFSKNKHFIFAHRPT